MSFQEHDMSTVNIMDSRAILRVDIGFYIGAILRPLLSLFVGSMSFWRTRNMDSSSYGV